MALGMVVATENGLREISKDPEFLDTIEVPL